MRYLVAGMILAVFIVLDYVTGGCDLNSFMRSVKRPRLPLTFPAWYVMGFIFFAACYMAMVPLLRQRLSGKGMAATFSLIVVVMTANAVWNLLLFLRRDYRLSFFFSFFYATAVAVLAWRVLTPDKPAGWLLLLFVSFVVYTGFWTYQVWKLNPPDQQAH